jgi:hypothetical protein
MAGTTDDKRPSPPETPEFAPEVRRALIEQLSKEIQASADNVLSLRTRYGFTVWVGPYIVLGAIIVGTKGLFSFDWHQSRFWVGLTVGIGCYLVLGYVAGRIERFALERSNQWRECIIEVANKGKIDPALYIDKEILPPHVVSYYVWLFAALLLCFFSVAVLVSTIHPNPEAASTTIKTPNPK